MPKTILSYPDENSIPAELRPFKITGTNNVEVHYGGDETVGKETNKALADKNTELLNEKKGIQDKYDALVKTSSGADLDTSKIVAENETLKRNAMTPEQKAIIEAVQSVNPNAKADDIKTTLTEFPKLQEKVSANEKAVENAKIFEHSGFKNPVVFETVMNNAAFNPNFEKVVWKDEQKDGKAEKVPYIQVKTPIEGKVEFSVADYAKNTSEWTPFIPSLNAGNGNQSNASDWIAQNTSGGGGSTGVKPTGTGNSLLDKIEEADNKQTSNVASPFNNAAPKSAAESVT